MTKAVRNPREGLGSARAAKGDHPAKQVFGLSSRATGGTWDLAATTRKSAT